MKRANGRIIIFTSSQTIQASAVHLLIDCSTLNLYIHIYIYSHDIRCPFTPWNFVHIKWWERAVNKYFIRGINVLTKRIKRIYDACLSITKVYLCVENILAFSCMSCVKYEDEKKNKHIQSWIFTHCSRRVVASWANQNKYQSERSETFVNRHAHESVNLGNGIVFTSRRRRRTNFDEKT